MRCHSVGCGTANQTQSRAQSTTRTRTHDAVVYDESGDVIEMLEHAGDFKEVVI
jgi:hypothetical protein